MASPRPHRAGPHGARRGPRREMTGAGGHGRMRSCPSSSDGTSTSADSQAASLAALRESPFRCELSLAPLVTSWTQTSAYSEFGRGPVPDIVREKVKHAPELTRVIEDLSVITQHKALVDLMMTAMSPPAFVAKDSPPSGHANALPVFGSRCQLCSFDGRTTSGPRTGWRSTSAPPPRVCLSAAWRGLMSTAQRPQVSSQVELASEGARARRMPGASTWGRPSQRPYWLRPILFSS
jgi:hypothetical protein